MSSDHGAGLVSPPEPSIAVNGARTQPRPIVEDAQTAAPQPVQARSAPGATHSSTDAPGRIHSEKHAASPLQTAQSESAIQNVNQNGSSIARVFVKAQPCPDTSVGVGKPTTMSMEVGNLPQQGGETCNIEFSFNVDEDSVQAIITEMQSELNLNLAEEEATIIHQKIDEELRRCSSHSLCIPALDTVVKERAMFVSTAGVGAHMSVCCRAQQAATVGRNGVQNVAQNTAVQNTTQNDAVQHGEHAPTFQFSPIPVRNGEMLEDRPGGAHFFQDARRSAFESSHGTVSEERRESNESEMAASVFTDAVPSLNGGGMPAPAAPGAARNGVGSCKLSEPATSAEQKDNGNAEPQSGPLKRVEFSELRKRFEEAHASGILRDTRA